MALDDAVCSAADVGSLGVCHLKRLWSKTIHKRMGRSPAPACAAEFETDKMVLYGLGLALEETLQYLCQKGPTYDEFEKWVLEKNGGAVDQASVRRINAIIRGKPYDEHLLSAIREMESRAPVLTAEDLSFWERNGYVIVPDAISAEQCRAAEQVVWDFLGLNPQASDDWYRKPRTHGIMVQMFHHPALSANRRSERIHKAFSQLWGTADLFTTVDRVGFNPPERPDWRFPGPHLHWDARLAVPFAFGLQGLLYLTDTPAEQGAFTCVPGFHRRIETWLQSLPPGTDPQKQDLKGLGAVPIAGRAGDLIIWHQALPHGSRPNRASRPRIVHYISMFPPPQRQPAVL